ncbi:MAG: sulfatase-like hydrolase/transferase [Chloroflexota bacterium]|nr:sulfatase-like hydrolase/transferase [Chloroflexota bacterium]
MASHPNVVIIVADEMCAGLIENPLVRAPNLSALAKDSVFFKQNFSVNPVCGPSRIANFTGLYPHVSGHRSLYQLLRPDEENLFKQLKDHGYYTVMAGKNDMMTKASLRASFSKRLKGPQGATLRVMRKQLRRLPLAKRAKLLWLAFRLFVLEHQSINDLYGDPRLKEFADILPSNQTPFPSSHRLHHSFYNGKAEPDSLAAQTDPIIFDSALQWLKKAPSKPFCLYIAATLPHPPYQVEEPYFSMVERSAVRQPISTHLDDKPHFMQALYARYKMDRLTPSDWSEMRAVYYGMVSKLDEQVGRIIETLKAQELYDDSLIIFLSDHGDYVGDYGLPEKWPTGFQDVLLHVPLILKYPKNMYAGRHVEHFTESIDLYPTVLEQTGVNTPYTHFGLSLTDLMEGEVQRDAVFAVGGYDLREPQAFEAGIASPDDPLMGNYFEKLKLQNDDPTTVARSAMIRTKDWKLVIRTAGKEELYDMKHDPNELTNREGDPSLEKVEEKLRERLLYWYLRTSDNPHWEHKRIF